MEPSCGVLVIVPVANRPDAVIEALEALRRQTRPPEHLIVVDDASSDNTPHVVRAWIDRSSLAFSAQLIVHPYNKGAAEARNTALRHAQGKYPYVYFLDSDDIPPADFLEKAITALRAKPNAVAVSSDRATEYVSDHKARHRELRTIADHPWLRFLKSTRRKPRTIADNPWLWFLAMGASVASCSVFRSDVIDQLGGYNEALPTGHDIELFMRVADLGEWLYVPDCTVSFRRLESRLSDRYRERHIAWCLIFEQSILLSTALNHIPHSEYRRILAHRWWYAARTMRTTSSYVEMEDCLRRSLAWRLCNKAIIDLLVLYATKQLRRIKVSVFRFQ